MFYKAANLVICFDYFHGFSNFQRGHLMRNKFLLAIFEEIK